MLGRTATDGVITAEEYLERERKSEVKHEYFAGETFAMGGAGRRHNLIVLNVAAELRHALRERLCEVYPSGMRVRVVATGLYAYPDVSVVCGEPSFEDDHLDTLLKPDIVVEVLSDSTEACDRGKKFENYRALESLTDFILISQDEKLVEHYARQPDGTWNLQELRGGQGLALTSINCEVLVDDIYLKVFQS